MCYPDREDYITLLFQFLEEFEASDTCNPTERRGHPQVYPGQFPDCVFRHNAA